MPNIIYEYLNEKGEKILIQGTESPDRLTRGDRDGGTPMFKKVEVTFEKALGTVKAVAGSLKNVIDEINPDEVSVEFSIKTEGEAGFFSICRASTGAEFKITLSWKNEKKDEK